MFFFCGSKSGIDFIRYHIIQLLWNKVLNGTKKVGIIVSFFCSSLFSVYNVATIVAYNYPANKPIIILR